MTDALILLAQAVVCIVFLGALIAITMIPIAVFGPRYMRWLEKLGER
jgi:hypothetical protein